jgi:S1-C subfamily serine protease
MTGAVLLMVVNILGILEVGMTDSRKGELVPDAVEIIRHSVVQIGFAINSLSQELRQKIGRDWFEGSLGTGILVNADGYVITARHVITEGQAFLNKIEVRKNDYILA